MGIECGVIAAIFLLFAVIFLRTKHAKWAVATLPLMLVPLTDFVIEILVLKAFKTDASSFAWILALFIAVAVSAAWIGLCAGQLNSKRTAATYVGISNVFNIVLAAILISNLLAREEQLASMMV